MKAAAISCKNTASFKLCGFGVLVLIIILFNRHFQWSQAFKSGEALAGLTTMVQEHLWQAALVYVGLTVLGCVVLALPGVLFAVGAGALFDPWLGTLLCLVATTLGAVASFLVSRFFLQKQLEPWLQKKPLLKKLLFEDTGRSTVVLLLITRLLPIFPYNLQNFAYGLTGIPLLPYTVYTFIFMLPGVALFTFGSALGISALGG